MEIEFLHIADAVDAVNGKLYMLGGCWNQHRSRSFPTSIRIGIAVGLLVTAEEAGATSSHRAVLHVIPAEGGGLVYGQEFEIAFEGRSLSQGMNHRNIIALNASLSIPRPGIYLVRAGVDNLEKTVTFEAVPHLEQ